MAPLFPYNTDGDTPNPVGDYWGQYEQDNARDAALRKNAQQKYWEDNEDFLGLPFWRNKLSAFFSPSPAQAKTPEEMTPEEAAYQRVGMIRQAAPSYWDSFFNRER